MAPVRLWELRAPAPMLPMRFFQNRAFALSNLASLFFSFGMFGSIFLLAQFFQTVQGYSPLDSGVRILPWTAMPMLVAPIAGAMSDRIGGHRLMAAGLALQAIGLAWIAAITTTTLPYSNIVLPFIISGTGMALFFAPVANVVLSAVRPEEQGQASGANNAIRELGGVLGVAVLASIFAHAGGYTHRRDVREGNERCRLRRRGGRRARRSRRVLHPPRARERGAGARARARARSRGVAPHRGSGGEPAQAPRRVTAV